MREAIAIELQDGWSWGPPSPGEGERAAAIQCALIGGARVNAIEESPDGTAFPEPQARGGGLDRKAHLNVGGREVAPGEPRASAQFGVPIADMPFELWIDE